MTKKVLVVVLGDLARSPRMQYHCKSLADNQYHVSVMATGARVAGLATNANNINQMLMPEAPDFKNYLPSILAYIIKPIWQSLLLIYQLCLISVPHVILVQNPPSIPTLPILCLYAKLFRSKLVIDWHNYGYSILSLNLVPEHPFVRVSKWIEIFFGRLADAGFCVSEAMKKDLVENFQISYPIHVLYDKPPQHFKPLSLKEKHEFFHSLRQHFEEFRSPSHEYTEERIGAGDDRIFVEPTRFTKVNDKNSIEFAPSRPALIISSTSWTEDEDFNLLLDALESYENTQLVKYKETGRSDLPDLVCVITGKGPLKAYYEEKINKCRFTHVQVILPWLAASDYAKMVASCDLGISLHKSSSGVDLPMKVVDMFGCGIPVLAHKYQAIGELLIEGVYGQTFTNSLNLHTKMTSLFKGFHNKNSETSSLLASYRENIKQKFLVSRWEDNWCDVAKPVLDRLCV